MQKRSSPIATFASRHLVASPVSVRSLEMGVTFNIGSTNSPSWKKLGDNHPSYNYLRTLDPFLSVGVNIYYLVCFCI